MFQIKEQNKTPEELSQMEKINLSDKEFKVMIIKKLSELGRRINEYSEKLNKELENIKKTQTEMKNTIIETNTRRSRLDGTEEQISKLKDRVVEITQAEQEKKNFNEKNEDSLKDLWDNNNILTFTL